MSITNDVGPWQYTASGSNATFAYLNKIFDEDELVVEVDGVLQTLSDYSVTGVGEDAGGTIVFDSNPTAAAVVVIYIDLEIVQPLTFLDNSRFPAANANDSIDRLTRLHQQAQHRIERTVRVDEQEDALDELPSASARRGKVVMFEDTAAAALTVGTPTTTVVVAASDTAAGIVELATNAETITGTDATRAVTPASLQALTATETRDGIVELATTAEAVTGTDTARAVTPAGVAAAIAAGSAALGWVPLARFVPTAAATFTISGASYFASTYSKLRLNLVGIRPATDNDDLRLRVSIAASVKSGASDYAWQYVAMSITSSAPVYANDGADSEIEVAENIGNASTEGLAGTLDLSSPASTTVIKQISWNAVFFNGSTQLIRVHGEGAYVSGVEALDQLVFHWATGGNFAAVGECFLEGLKTS